MVKYNSRQYKLSIDFMANIMKCQYMSICICDLYVIVIIVLNDFTIIHYKVLAIVMSNYDKFLIDNYLVI